MGNLAKIQNMPTPFTHLHIAQQLLKDEQLPLDIRAAITPQYPAFLLGSIAADARVSSNVGREVTHFYHYEIPMTEHPWRVMLAENATLHQSHSSAQRAFLAGYVAHLAVDEYWSLNMVRPYFGEGDWRGVSQKMRFLALHLILIYMDSRDCDLLNDTHAQQLRRAQPNQWLPFMGDDVLSSWRDFIAEQLADDGCGSQTLAVFGQRLGMTPAQIRLYCDDEAMMEKHLWRYVPREALARVEPAMVTFARQQMMHYWGEFT